MWIWYNPLRLLSEGGEWEGWQWGGVWGGGVHRVKHPHQMDTPVTGISIRLITRIRNGGGGGGSEERRRKEECVGSTEPNSPPGGHPSHGWMPQILGISIRPIRETGGARDWKGRTSRQAVCATNAAQQNSTAGGRGLAPHPDNNLTCQCLSGLTHWGRPWELWKGRQGEGGVCVCVCVCVCVECSVCVCWVCVCVCVCVCVFWV